MVEIVGLEKREDASQVKIKWLREAIQDLIAIQNYIAEDHPTAATQTANRVLETIAYLRDHPGIGRAGRIPGTREVLIPGLPYIVPYRVKGEAIEILGVLHTSREWPKKF